MVWTLPISSKGQITIPLQAREQLGLTGNQKRVILTQKDQKLTLQPISNNLLDLYGVLKSYNKQPVVEDIDQVIKETRRKRAAKRAMRSL